MCTHLIKRNAIYYFRRRIPLALVAHFGRNEVVHSLRTSDRREAERLARQEGCRYDNIFAELEGKVPQVLDAHPETKQQRTLKDAFRRWQSLHQRAVKTENLYNRVVERFADFLGDVSVAKISRADCRRFRDNLKDNDLSIKTVNNYLACLSSILTVAIDEEWIQSNPVEGLSLREDKRAKEKRLPFDDVSLKRIFNSPVFHGERPKAGAGEAAYWLPLLALYTGARLEELGQLHPDDIHQEDCGKGSVWVMEITDRQEGQHLKNSGSRRRIPIHGELIRLGFIKFAQSQSGERIFHQLKVDVFGTLTGNWSKWFGRYLRKVCGVHDKRMVFHSFRHTFKDQCRLAGIDEAIHDALTGHSSGTVSRHYGGLNYPLEPLVNAVENLRFRTI